MCECRVNSGERNAVPEREQNVVQCNQQKATLEIAKNRFYCWPFPVISSEQDIYRN